MSTGCWTGNKYAHMQTATNTDAAKQRKHTHKYIWPSLGHFRYLDNWHFTHETKANSQQKSQLNKNLLNDLNYII